MHTYKYGLQLSINGTCDGNDYLSTLRTIKDIVTELRDALEYIDPDVNFSLDYDLEQLLP